MDIAINWWAVIVCGVFSMVLGMLWYGPMLFGKMWGRIIGMTTPQNPEEMKAMQKQVMPYYVLQFILSILTAYVLAHYSAFTESVSGMTGAGAGARNAFWIWFGFIVPIAAGGAMWSGKSKKVAWQMFLITAGYQLVFLVVSGIILALWK